MQPFEIDMETIRRRARDHMMKGPLTPAYGSREHDGPHSTEADRQRIVAVLQETLATELVCELRYRAHYYAAAGCYRCCRPRCRCSFAASSRSLTSETRSE